MRKQFFTWTKGNNDERFMVKVQPLVDWSHDVVGWTTSRGVVPMGMLWRPIHIQQKLPFQKMPIRGK